MNTKLRANTKLTSRNDRAFILHHLNDEKVIKIPPSATMEMKLEYEVRLPENHCALILNSNCWNDKVDEKSEVKGRFYTRFDLIDNDYDQKLKVILSNLTEQTLYFRFEQRPIVGKFLVVPYYTKEMKLFSNQIDVTKTLQDGYAISTRCIDRNRPAAASFELDVNDDDEIQIEPSSIKDVTIRCQVIFPAKYCGLVMNRNENHKRHLYVYPFLIDNGIQNWIVTVKNMSSTEMLTIRKNEKIAQLLLLKYNNDIIYATPQIDYHTSFYYPFKTLLSHYIELNSERGVIDLKIKDTIKIDPLSRSRVYLDLKLDSSFQYCVLATNKAGYVGRKKINVEPQLIEGFVHLIVENLSDEMVTFEKYECIAQFIIIQRYVDDVVVDHNF